MTLFSGGSKTLMERHSDSVISGWPPTLKPISKNIRSKNTSLKSLTKIWMTLMRRKRLRATSLVWLIKLICDRVTI